MRLLPTAGLVVLLATSSAIAQQPPVAGEAPFSPAEIRRLLDAYAVMQVQEFLGLTDAQFAQFLPRLKVLQETRRRDAQARVKLIQDLNRMTAPSAAQIAESEVRGRLRELRDLEDRSTGELRKSYENVDQVLSVQQQARFRVFEQQMERRQFELLLRARARGAGLARGERPLAPRAR